MSKQKWNAEIVVSAIKVRYENGEPLNSNHMQQRCNLLYQAACKYFGSWKSAIEATGISYDSVKVKVPNRKVVWTKDVIVEKVKTLHKEGFQLNSNHIQQNKKRLYGAACKYFGSWGAAVEAAGISYDSVRVGSGLRWSSKELVIARVRERFVQGESIKYSVVSKEESGLVQAVQRFFPGKNSWRRAREAAGFSQVDEHPLKKWDEQTIIRTIKKLRRRGISLNVGAMQEGNLSKLYAAGRNRFGSWKAAVEAAEIPYKEVRQVRSWTKRKVIKKIRKLFKQGVRLNLVNIRKLDSGLLGAAIYRFGSWGAAVEVAGISYQSHCKVWSTKAWLQRMTNQDYEEILRSARSHSGTFEERSKK